MKKFYFTLIFLFFGLAVSAQNNEGMPVTDVTIIKRVVNPNTETAKGTTEKSSLAARAISTSTTPTGSATEVGVTEGQLTISLSGNTNYSIPIAVPPGINGIEPEISLSYNSQRGLYGTAAYGWDITGVSSITRIPSTKFHDGVIDAVDFDSLDRFAFDGQRLMIKSGTTGVYGANGTVYETEYFSNLKITSYGTHPSGANYGPAYFVVEYPDGSKAYYGNSTDSRSVTEWSITYWENPQGVRISYGYTISNNSLYISSVKYGSLTTITPINEIQFVYGTSSFTEEGYVAGVNIKRNKKLTDIKVIGNGVGFRNYMIDNPYNNQIRSITEKSGDGTKSYNPTVFDYDSTSQSISYLPVETTLNVGNIESRNAAAISGDFDADGRMDCIVYPTFGPETKKKYWLYTDIQSGDNTNIGVSHDVGAFEDIFPTKWLSWNNKVMPEGWTVAKKTDTNYTFTVYSAGTTSPIYKQYDKVVNFPLTYVDTEYEPDCYPNIPSGNYMFPKKILSGDFNGDGLTDVIAIDTEIAYKKDCQIPPYDEWVYNLEDAVNSKKVYFVDLKRDNTSNFLHYAGELATELIATSKVEVADFNGDGKSDFFVFDAGYVKIYTLSDTNTLILLYKNTTADASIVLDKPILMGDYNGDGKFEFVIPKAFNNSNWYKYTSTGISLIKEERSFSPSLNPNTSYDTYDFVASDFNNDGKTDLIYLQSSRNTEGTLGRVNIGCYPNINGDIAGTASWANSGYQPDINIYALPIYLPQQQQVSYNGVNYLSSTLEVAFVNQNKLHFFSSENNYKKNNLLTNITTGNGVAEAITYTPLDSRYTGSYGYDNIYSPSKGISNYPNLDIIIDLNTYVVSKLEKRSKDVYKKRLFSYYGAVSNLEGLGNLGFRSVVQTDWHDDNTTLFSNITKNDIDLRGVSVENYTVLGIASPLTESGNQKKPSKIVKDGNYTVTGSEDLVATQSITLKPNTWIKSGSTFSAKIAEDANVSTSAPTDFITKTLSNYDSELLSNKVFKLKNILTKHFNSLNNTSSETRTTYDVYNNPVTATTLLKEAGVTAQTTISAVSYNAPTASPYVVGRPANRSQSVTAFGDTMDSEEFFTYSNNLLTQIKKRGTNTNYIVEDNQYDAFGNITKKTMTVAGLTPRTTNHVYDTSGRFLIKSTDIEALSTTFDYNLSNGLLVKETNPYGLSTSYTYDPWFKKLTVKDDKLDKTITYTYTKSAEKSIVTTTTDVLDGSASEETFDDLGRVIKSGGKDLNGNFSYISYLYDIYNRAYKVSEPYFGATPSQWNETKFDIYSRPIENISFNTRSTSAQYNGLTSTFIDGQKTKTVVKNAMGNVVATTETTGGTINYNYFANGNLKQTNYNGVKINIEQDGWGQKTKLIDPSAGVFTYTHNQFGELTVETSQNGAVVTTITRDDNGKPLKKTIVGAGTDSETIYAYDATTKLITSITFTDNKEPVGSNKIITTYTYDAIFKRVIKVVEEKTGISKFSTSFTYDGLGRVATQIKEAQLGSKTSLVTTKNVYKNGDLYQIVDNVTNKVLWQTNSINAKGQILESILGNGTKMTNTYDNNGYLSKIQHDKTTTPTNNIITLTTQFDFKTDNLNSRSNSAFGNYTETFEYDEINRLKEFTNKTGIQEVQNYDPSGKIKDNKLGTYEYAISTKPYQNTSITLTPEATGYYANREGIFNDSMEDKKDWATARSPSTIFFSYDGSKAHTGKNALKLANTTTTEQYVHSDKWIAIDNAVATEYTYSAWIYSDGPQAQVFLFMKTPEETGYLTSVDNAATSITNQWTKIEKTFLVPANIKKLNIRLDNNGQGNIWFDDVQIRKTSNPATAVRALNVTYNAFKRPLQIEETGVDKISFTYNEANQRSTMFYGGLQDDKLLRPLRKHYAADGSMEIKQNRTTGAVEFVTYIGGDGYTAPIVYKITTTPTTNNQEQVLYLHRDYQGTILAITAANAAIVEKRLFDAWGALIKVQDGAGNTLAGLTVLDRGYTGHEHLQSVALIHMNARLYDPILHRFLQIDNYIQDPTNTQNYNQYGYVMNNPLLYTDPSGNQYGDGKDCTNCGLSGTEQRGLGGLLGTIKDNWDNWGIKDWAKRKLKFSEGTKNWMGKNLNFKNWGRSIGKLFGGGKKNAGPPPNTSKYSSINTTGFTGGQVGMNNAMHQMRSFDSDPKVYKKAQEIFNDYTTGIGNTLTGIGGYAAALEDISHVNAGKVYKYGTKTMSALQLSRANKVFQLRVAKFASVGGKALGAAGGLVSTYQYSQNQISGYELSADLIMTGVGVFGGPIGAGASLIYFGGKTIYNYYNPNNPVFATPKN